MIGAEGYSASSPDELALVNAAKYLGYEFVGRNAVENSIEVLVESQPRIYHLQLAFEFTSARKRMTSIFRTPDGQYLVCIKGADSTVLPLCTSDNDELLQKTISYTDAYAREGLRTLVFAQKIMSEDDFQSWNSAYLAASLDLSNDKYKRMEEVAAVLE